MFQCGRINEDEFVSDHDDNAMSALQAFAITLAVVGWRVRYFWL